MPELLTDRLSLRPYRTEDIAALARIMADPRVMRHIGKGALSRDEVAEIVARYVSRWRDIGMGWWAIRRRSDGSVIGQIGLKPVLEMPQLIEVGFALEPKAWGKGLAEEALREVLRHARDAHGLSRVVALVRPENEYSARLLIRCGFVLEALLDLRNRPLELYAASL